mmetsp:Transcript_48294/g.95341  ORF Transcript_48294/g.95341 Transcript_48294/m.95341 type:complete len:90 (+) Transcript_48294:878-1147(+)
MGWVDRGETEGIRRVDGEECEGTGGRDRADDVGVLRDCRQGIRVRPPGRVSDCGQKAVMDLSFLNVNEWMNELSRGTAVKEWRMKDLWS